MRVADGAQLWGNQYDRPQADLISVQETIAGEILAKVRPQVTGEEKLLATKPQACMKILMAICTQFGQKVAANRDALRSLAHR